jgi:exodeoxyribonuclease VII small subunit
MAEKTFEQALSELETLVKELENGEIELNDAVKKYNKGMELSKHCHDLLVSAEGVIVKMMKDDKLEEFNK